MRALVIWKAFYTSKTIPLRELAERTIAYEARVIIHRVALHTHGSGIVTTATSTPA